MTKKKVSETGPSEIILYTTLECEASAELTERRSVFIGCAAPVRTADEANRFIARIRSKHADASHNVYAYLLNEGNIMRHSDDGEPQGTAGIPVLDVIRKRGFCDAVITVTRYFGGVLLGAGGLIRAYTAAASLAVEKAHVISFERYTEFQVRCNYSEYQKIEHELPKFGIKCDDTDFSDDITLKLAIRDVMFDDFSTRITEMTAGRVCVSVTGKRFDK
ncbi:MAG: YigZ family protein [Eubacteriales bacterium]